LLQEFAENTCIFIQATHRILFWVTYLDVEEFLSEHWWALINWLSRTIENSAQHFYAHRHAEYITSELTGGSEIVDIGGSFEDL